MNIYKCFILAFVMIFSPMTSGVSAFSIDKMEGDNLQRNIELTLPLDNPSPLEVWNKTYGGVARDKGWVVHQTQDGGFILDGYTTSYGNGQNDIWLIKTDSNGNKIWDKTYGGTGSESSRSVHQTEDGGYIIGGSTDSFGNGNTDFLVIKTDAAGILQWQKTFGTRNEDYCQAVQQLPNGNYILTGDWDLSGTSDLCLIEIDSEGNELWSKLFSGDQIGFPSDLQLTSDGGFIIAGTLIDLSGNAYIWLLKTDVTGDLIWEKTFGTDVPQIAIAVHQTTDNGFFVGGWTMPSDLKRSMVVLKVDETGNLLWEKRFPIGQSTESYVNGPGLDVTNDGSYIIAGEQIVSQNRNAWLIKTDMNGNVLWNVTIGGVSDDYSCGVQQIDDEHYIIIGATSSYGAGGYDVWLIKVSQGNGTLPPLTPAITGSISGKVNTDVPVYK